MFKQLLNLLGIRPQEDAFEKRHNHYDDAEDGGNTGRSAAFNRLRLVLMHDRTQLEPHVLESLRDELVEVISKYITVDQETIELNLETDPETNQVALMASIPVKRNAGVKESDEGAAAANARATESV